MKKIVIINLLVAIFSLNICSLSDGSTEEYKTKPSYQIYKI